MIRKGGLQDLNKLIELVTACRLKMEEEQIFQWNHTYPLAKDFEEDFKREELFVLESESDVLGCIVISSVMDDFYEWINWKDRNHKALYIHRLAVHPKNQGQGIARKLMDFAEDFGRKNGFEAIRLDTFSQNKRNQKFYENRNYSRLDDIYFPNQSEHPFYCYELIL